MGEEEERELNSILEEALKLRQSQDAVLKRNFDGLPPCVQKTLFTNTDRHSSPLEVTNNNNRPDHQIPFIDDDVVNRKDRVKDASSSPGGDVKAKPPTAEDLDATKLIEDAKRLESEGDLLSKRTRIVEALEVYEKAVGKIFFVTLRPGAPHWRDRGVRDDYIRINRLDDVLASRLLTKTAECLLRLNQVNEAISLCDWSIRLDAAGNALGYLARAKARLRTSRPDVEDLVLRDLAKSVEIDPINDEAKRLIADIRSVVDATKQKEKRAFGGVLNKPGLRLVDDDDDDGIGDHPRRAKDQPKRDKKVRPLSLPPKFELDPLELEAARFAGLDVNDPVIRELLLRLSTAEGRELFDREQERLRKLEQRDSARKRFFFGLFLCILFAIGLQSWLKTMTINQPVYQLGSILRVQAIRERVKNERLLPSSLSNDGDDERAGETSTGSVKLIL